MAVITDVGDKDDIHPTKKEPVGARLALLARKIAYGEKIVADGPAYNGVKFKDGKAILSFENIDGGLEAKGGRADWICHRGQKIKISRGQMP